MWWARPIWVDTCNRHRRRQCTVRVHHPSSPTPPRLALARTWPRKNRGTEAARPRAAVAVEVAAADRRPEAPWCTVPTGTWPENGLSTIVTYAIAAFWTRATSRSICAHTRARNRFGARCARKRSARKLILSNTHRYTNGAAGIDHGIDQGHDPFTTNTVSSMQYCRYQKNNLIVLK